MSNMRPNRTAYDRQSVTNRQLDAVYLQWRTLSECSANIDPNGGGGDCDIWMSVYGFTNTSYSITASVVNGTQRTMLLDGIPANGYVEFRHYVYYYAYVNVPSGQTFSVNVQSTVGDADMYIRLDGQNPAIGFAQFSSTKAVGTEIINIGPSSPYYSNSCLMVRLLADAVGGASDLGRSGSGDLLVLGCAAL